MASRGAACRRGCAGLRARTRAGAGGCRRERWPTSAGGAAGASSGPAATGRYRRVEGGTEGYRAVQGGTGGHGAMADSCWRGSSRIVWTCCNRGVEWGGRGYRAVHGGTGGHGVMADN